MSDKRELLILVRRKGDVVAPTIGDLYFASEEDPFLEMLERPRQPDPKDYVEGAAHPCIPTGEYDVDWTEFHPKHPGCYQLKTGPGTPAPDRSDILQHKANWIRELEGCQAPGLKAEIVEGDYKGEHVRELGVSSSGPALDRLVARLGKRPYRLRIVDLNQA